MNIKNELSEEEIDNIVISQADNDSEWEETTHVCRTKPTSLFIPHDLASRSAFLARLHRKSGVEEWLMCIIRERIEIEELAFFQAKRELVENENANRFDFK